MFLRLRFSTGGDAHGPELVGILSGLPAGLPVDLSRIRHHLRLRREAGGRGGRSRWIEQDEVEIRGGVYQGTTSGAPLVLVIPNRGARNWEQESQPRVARPGHADYPGMVKYGWTSWMPIAERASGRRTALWTAFGALALSALQTLGVEILGFVRSLGSLPFPDPEDPGSLHTLRTRCRAHPFYTLDPAQEPDLETCMEELRRSGTTLGGTIRVTATGLPPGLGSCMDPWQRLDVRLSAALMSIPSVVSVGFGDPEHLARQPGRTALDAFDPEHPGVRQTNHQGGLEGGMTNGMPLRILLHCKPVPTQRQGLTGFDPARGTPHPAPYRRSDLTAVPAISVVAEAVTALVLLDTILEQTGGDHWAEVQTRWAAYRRRVSSLQPPPQTGRTS